MRTITLKSAPVLLPCLLLVAWTTGCATDRQVIEQADQFHTALQPAVVTPKESSELSRYIQQVGNRIINAARDYHREHPDTSKGNDDWMFSKDMEFHFVNSKTLNAFTTGGEHMYVYTELFQKSRSEDELAAVMAHEFAHVYRRHVAEGMNRQYGILGAAALAGAAGYAVGGSDKGAQYAGTAGGLALTAGQLVGMSFTRGDEGEADKFGFEFYTRAGWDPNKFGDFFKHMIDMGYDKGSEYFSDHPSLSSRYENARKWASELPRSYDRYRRPPVADSGEFKRLQEEARRIADRMPNDKSLAQSQKLLAALPRSCLTPAIHHDQEVALKSLQEDAEKAKKRKKNAKAD